MNMHSGKVAAMLAADAPAAHDIAFELAVLARIEQRRYRRGMAANVALAVTAAILLALVMPDIEDFWQSNIAASLSNGMIAVLLFALMLPLQWRMMRRA